MVQAAPIALPVAPSQGRYVIVLRVGQPAELVPMEDVGLEFLQGVVGGLVDVVRLARGVDLWVNDEGLCLGLPGNRVVGEWFIAGDAVLCASTPDGDSVGLTADVAAAWLSRASRWPHWSRE